MKTKKLSTPLKIIKILKLMTEKPVTVEEILSTLEEDNSFVNKETISKYFTTLRNAGCDIQKRRNKFYIKYPILNFPDNELGVLSAFQKIAKNLCTKSDYSEFLKFMDKLFTLTDTDEIKRYKAVFYSMEDKNLIDISKFKDKIETISNFMGDNARKIKITVENKTYTVVPLKFHYLKNSVCLYAYDVKENINKNFPLSLLHDIKQTPLSAQSTDFSLSTTFKITGGLKNTYQIKEGEIISPFEDYIVVTNKKEDKEQLFKRLLRYGTNCEILYPKSDREKFKNLVKYLILNHS